MTVPEVPSLKDLAVEVEPLLAGRPDLLAQVVEDLAEIVGLPSLRKPPDAL